MMRPIGIVLDRLKGKGLEVRKNGHGYLTRCPAHADREPSLSVNEGDDGRALVKCFAGCTVEAVCQALELKVSDLFVAKRNPSLKPAVNGVTPLQPTSCTLEDFAAAKKLPVEFLASQGWKTVTRNGRKVICIPCFSADLDCNTPVALRYRVAMSGRRFESRRGDHPTVYGLNWLPEIRRAGWVLIVEGESDAVTARYHGIPCVGIPGKATWRSEWGKNFEGLECYVWQEPDAQDFTRRIGRDIPSLRVVVAPAGLKDISEAHIAGHKLPEFLETLRGTAIPYSQIVERERAALTSEYQHKAAGVLAAEDPLELIKRAIRSLGYGGDIGPALITYLAATSRLLLMRAGGMPVHLLLLGPPAAGKSYTLSVILRLLPPEAYHIIDAGSPRILIYDREPLRHRLVFFAEADSLPAGEDNPAASAIRNLLQDHHLHYSATVRDPETGGFTVQDINKPGPTVLVTTATRRLGAQLDSRLFSLEIPDDQLQMRSALMAQANVELQGCAEPSEGLIAFQSYLQSLAPVDVIVPYARWLAEAIATSPVSARATRDFARLLSLIKGVCVLRHTHRGRDESGRFIAQPEDYRTVYELVGEMYSASATGASEKVRKAVEAVSSLAQQKKPATVTAIAEMLGINKMAASRRVKTALRGGWLGNRETRRGMPADLVQGEPLPVTAGLPDPEALPGGECNTVTAETAEGKAQAVATDTEDEPAVALPLELEAGKL